MSALARGSVGLQLGYALAFAGLVLWPNFAGSPSLLLVVAAVLTATWVLGCLAALAGLARAGELMLCGAAAPLLVGLTQQVYRIGFLVQHGSPDLAGGSLRGFVLVWVLESALVLVPGAGFLWRNVRALPAPPEDQPPVPSRPASRNKRI